MVLVTAAITGERIAPGGACIAQLTGTLALVVGLAKRTACRAPMTSPVAVLDKFREFRAGPCFWPFRWQVPGAVRAHADGDDSEC